MDKHIETLVQRYPQLESCKDDILKAYQILEEAYSAGRKLLVAGNGGSASDSEHIVGELMKEFKLKRKIYAAQIDRLMQRLNLRQQQRCPYMQRLGLRLIVGF